MHILVKNVILFSLIIKSQTSTKCDVNPNVEVLLEPKKESQKKSAHNNWTCMAKNS